MAKSGWEKDIPLLRKEIGPWAEMSGVSARTDDSVPDRLGGEGAY